MTAVLDNRAQLGGAPGLHAFIVGVSDYAHLPGGGGTAANKTFGLKQLTATANSAFLFYEWLVGAHEGGRLPLPLATVHLLLSPSPVEVQRRPQLATVGGATPAATELLRATRRNFVAAAAAWRDAASANRDQMTVFYFAGHGVQRKQKDAVLLLSDFGEPAAGGSLTNTVDANHLIAGMAPPPNPAKTIANRQIYFIDACRLPAAEFQQTEWQNVPDVWNPELNGRDDRLVAAYYATVPGSTAYALTQGQTLFSMALFRCLDRLGAVPPDAAAADPRWAVTTLSLIKALPDVLTVVNEEHRGDQEVATDGQFRDAPLVFLTNPPEVDVEVTIDPAAAVPLFMLEIEDDQGNVRPVRPVDPHPYVERLPAGIYRFRARIVAPPHSSFQDARVSALVRPPRHPWRARVSP